MLVANSYCVYLLPTAEIVRLEQEKATDFERFEYAKESLNQRLQQLDRDSQLALSQEKQAHEEDVDRLSQERVSDKDVERRGGKEGE